MQILEDIRFGERSSPGRAKQLMSAVVQVFGCRHRGFNHALRRPASEKRQGTNAMCRHVRYSAAFGGSAVVRRTWGKQRN